MTRYAKWCQSMNENTRVRAIWNRSTAASVVTSESAHVVEIRISTQTMPAPT